MGILKLSWTYISRKKNRSISIFLILLLISSVLYASLSINKTNTKLEEKIYKISNSSFSVKPKNKLGSINPRIIEKISKNKLINKTNYKYDSVVQLEKYKVVNIKQNVQLDGIKNNNFLSLESASNTDLLKEFSSGVFKIVKGKAINEHDKSKILIHEKLAKENNLKIGDKITISNAYNSQISNSENVNMAKNNKKITLEVIGIFTGKKQENYNGLSSDLSENTVYADYNSAQKLGEKDSDKNITEATFFTKNLKSMEKIISDIKKNNNKAIQIQKDSKAFNTIFQPIKIIKNIIQTIIISLVFSGILVICLILIFNIRQRLNEIGIMLSIGISKKQIISQFICELLLISLPAFIISIITGVLIKNTIFKNLTINASENFSGNSFFTVETFTTGLQTYGIILGIIVISITITSLIFLSQKPKTILSQTS